MRLIKALALFVFASSTWAQTTTVTQAIVGPDGLPGTGTVYIRISSPCSYGGSYVGAKTVAINFAPVGSPATTTFSAALVPNAGGCAGTGYSVSWTFRGGVTEPPETWVVPVSGSPVSVDSVKTSPTITGIIVKAVRDYSINIATPQTGDTGLWQYVNSLAYSIAAVSCSTDQGTVTINLDVRTSAAPNTAGGNVLASPLVCASTGTISGTPSSPLMVPVSAPVNVQVLAISGSPTIVRIYVVTQ